QRTFALAQLDVGVDAGLHALADEAERLAALLERTRRHVALRQEPRKLQVGTRDAGREHEARDVAIGLRRAGVSHRGLEPGAVAAEQVEVPRSLRLQVRERDGGAAERRR